MPFAFRFVCYLRGVLHWATIQLAWGCRSVYSPFTVCLIHISGTLRVQVQGTYSARCSHCSLLHQRAMFFGYSDGRQAFEVYRFKRAHALRFRLHGTVN